MSDDSASSLSRSSLQIGLLHCVVRTFHIVEVLVSVVVAVVFVVLVVQVVFVSVTKSRSDLQVVLAAPLPHRWTLKDHGSCRLRKRCPEGDQTGCCSVQSLQEVKPPAGSLAPRRSRHRPL